MTQSAVSAAARADFATALDFCRLAAQRIAPADLDAEVEGPMDLANTVLRGASVFAA